MNKVLLQATKLVVPTKKLQYEKSKVAMLAFQHVHHETVKYPEIIDVEFGGSYAKGTWLPDKADVDIFIKFDKSTPEKKFVEISKKVGFDSLREFNPYVRYSEHPYVEAIVKKTKVNVVPCYKIDKGNWKSSADRSPYHTEFMLESLSGKMKDDVRLLKAFLNGNKIYGAEIARQGFSGYVCEVLIWNFRSFENLIKNIAKIKQNKIIGKTSKEFDTPIVIMDPIDSNRNLAAAISDENMGRFVLASREFLKKPSIEFFKSKPKKGKRNLENTVVVKFKFKPRSPDIIWGQIKRAANALAVQLEMAGFKVLRFSSITDEKNLCSLIFLLESLKIPESRVKEGPEFFNENDSNSFISKNLKKSKLMWIGKNRKIFSLEKRPYNESKKFLSFLLKKQLNKSGIPKGLKIDIKKGFKISEAAKISEKSIKEAILDLCTTDGKIFSANKQTS